MNPTSEQLKAQGWIESSDGVWHRGKRVRWEPFTDIPITPKTTPKPPRRIRQSTKPLLNKLEQEYLDHLELFRVDGCTSKIYAQAMTFRLANGLRFTVDLFAFDWPDVGELNRPTAFEVKGPWFTDDANAKLKMFAHAYPEIRVVLAWRNGIFWQTQKVLP